MAARPRTVTYTPTFFKNVKKLSRIDVERITRGIEDILKDPRCGAPLIDRDAEWKYRIGKLRIIYVFTATAITFISCGPRKNVYD